MSYRITDLLNEEYNAGQDIQAKTLLVMAQTDNDVALVATDGASHIFGVAMCSVSEGQCLGVMTIGIYPVIVSSAVLPGDPITSDANGYGRKAIAGEYIIGYAIEAGPPGKDVPVRIVGQRI